MNEAACSHGECDAPPLFGTESCWIHLSDRDGFLRELTDAAENGQDLAGIHLTGAGLRRGLIDRGIGESGPPLRGACRVPRGLGDLDQQLDQPACVLVLRPVNR